jgi:hypothetical protein
MQICIYRKLKARMLPVGEREEGSSLGFSLISELSATTSNKCYSCIHLKEELE